MCHNVVLQRCLLNTLNRANNDIKELGLQFI